MSHEHETIECKHINGIIIWCINGKRHNENGPAVIYPDGTKVWCINGKPHREDGPAIINSNGSKEWWINGKPHREDGPAIINSNGSKEWWINGKRHSEKKWIKKTTRTSFDKITINGKEYNLVPVST